VRDLLAQVRETVLGAYAHQELPFERLVEDVSPERTASGSPLFSAKLVLQNAPEGRAEVGGLELSAVEGVEPAAKLDLHLAVEERSASARSSSPSETSSSSSSQDTQLSSHSDSQSQDRVSSSPSSSSSSSSTDGAGLDFVLTYPPARFSRVRVERLAAHYLRALEFLARPAPAADLHELELTDEAERARVMELGRGEALPVTGTLVEWVDAQAARTPDRLALVGDTQDDTQGDTQDNTQKHAQSYTYAELRAQSNRLARYLRSLGVGRETRVALCLGRVPEFVVAVLAVWKAGGAYVPLDPEHPAARLSALIEDAGAAVVVTREAVRARVPSHWGVEVSMDGAEAEAISSESDQPLEFEHDARSLAYVLYTSGSTGEPKGVMVEHAQLANYVRAVSTRLDLEGGLNYALVSTVAADLGHTTLYPALVTGGTLHLLDAQSALDGARVREYFRAHHIDCVKVTPSQLRAWRAGAGGEVVAPRRKLILGGEAARRQWVQEARQSAPDCEVWNHYGPTETTVGVTAGRADSETVAAMTGATSSATGATPSATSTTTASATLSTPSTGASLPLGAPLGNGRLYVLDARGGLCPVGVAGELYVGGAGVARGYVNRPGVTAERFVPDPFSGQAGARLYRTGDVVRWREVSNSSSEAVGGTCELEFIGRADAQVKLRGYRVELGEVEAVLAAHAGVNQCAVIVVDIAGTQTLVAYVAGEADPAEVREHAAQQLPSYMVPQRIVKLDSLPLTPNGKLDRKALPAPDMMDAVMDGGATSYLAPRTACEEIVCNVWAEVLGRERVGVGEDFFELGGHSLLATQVVSRVRAVFGVEVPLRVLFETPTVEALAAEVERLRQVESGAGNGSVSAPPLVRRERGESGALDGRGGHPPLSFAQQRLWFIDQLEPGNPAYNSPRVVRLEGELDHTALVAALTEIVRRHEVLRTSFPSVDGAPVQLVHEAHALNVPVVDVEHLAEGKEQAARAVVEREAARPFDLSAGPVVRALLVRLSQDEHVLVVVLHHIVSDGWSAGVLVREFGLLYEAFRQGQPSPLAELPVQYADYAVWQRAWLQGEVLERQLAYWREQLRDLEALELPTDYARQTTGTSRGAVVRFELNSEVTAQLREVSRKEGVTLFMLLTAAFQLLLSRYSGQRDVAVGTAIANRNRLETEPLVGFFINQLVLRARVDECRTTRDLLAQVRETVLGAYAHQDLPFERLVEEVHAGRDLSRSPLFQAMFLYERREPQAAGLADVADTAQEVEHQWAKFDLTLMAEDTPEGLGLRLEYATDLFKHSTAERFARSLQLILEAFGARPEQPLAQLPVVDAAESALISKYWNMTTRPYESRLVHEFFEAQTARTPDRKAITCGDASLTYAELNRRADALAARLVALGASPERRVAVCVERGFDLPVALLGVLKSGSAYVPVDPEYPRERVSYVLADSGATLLLTQRHLLATLPQTSGTVVYVDAPEEGDVQATAATGMTTTSTAVAGARVACVPANTAYVIYTSGSTGQPKGVAVSHDNVANFFAGMDDAIADGGEGKWLAVTTVSFDISVLELFWTLARGFEVVFPSWVESASQQESLVEASATQTTDFSLFYFAAEDGGGGDAYRLLLEGAKFADEHGFSAVWTPERHFHAFGGIYPNPALTSAAVASVTRNIAIRSGSVVLPLRHPVAVAEDWAVVDNLSRGRAGVSFASGWHAADFVLAPEAYADRKALMLRNIEVVRALWRGETIRLPGGAGKEVDVRIHPRPVQKEIPIWLTAAGNPETFRIAGQIGANLLTHLLGQSVEELAANVRVYREARRESGREGAGHVTLMVHTFVAPDEDVIREQVRAPFTEYLRQSLDLVRAFGRAIGLDVDASEFSSEDMEALLGHAADRYMDAASLIGTPEKCLAMAAELKAAGVDEIACLIDFGVEFEATLESLRLLDAVRLAANRPASHSESIPAVIREQGITHLQCTPSLAGMLLAEAKAGDLASLRGLFVGGEALPGALVSELRDSYDAPIFNMYGPTETTIWSAVKPVGDVNGGTVTLANPIANTQLYVLDGEGMLCPVGVAGELYIGGAGVGLGYVNRPELTAEKFVPDAFGERPGARLYRTGDVVRRREDGELEFLGRRDGQVKLRGYRIELGEVEAVLATHAGVRQCAVAVREIAGAQTLVAYVAGEADPAELREHAATRLPSYMIPQRIVRLDALPLTDNGKLDRKALPAPDEVEATQAASSYAAPRTPTEEIVCNVWAEVLGRERVGIGEDFFELGGHSLLATQVVSRVRAVFGVEVALRVLFETPTAEALAAEVERLRDAESGTTSAPPQLVRADRNGRLPLSFAQQRLWFIDQLEPGNPAYNSPRVVRLEGELDHTALVAALTEIVRRHEVLRTSFPTVNGKPVQRIGEAREMAVPVVDVEPLGGVAGERAARELAEREASRLFNLATGPMLRTLLVRLNRREHVLVLVLHHVVSDAWSTGVLIREFGMLYEAYRHGQPSPLAELKVQYADYAVWQRGWLKGDVLKGQLSYWRTQLEGLQPIQLLTDRPRSSASGNRLAGWHSFRWSAETAQKLNSFSRREGVSLYMTLLAGFQALLSSYTGQNDIAVGTDVANRTLLETEGLIGFFINQLVLRTRIAPGMTFREMLRSVRETTLEGYAHQELPFEKLVEELAPERHLDRSPLFQVKLILQNAPESELSLGEVSLSQLPIQQPEGRFELVLSIVESPGGISGNVEFAAGLYDEMTIARMMEHLRLLLENVSDEPDTLVSGLQMTAAAEREQLLAFGAGAATNSNVVEATNADASANGWRGVHELFAAQVARTPHGVAVLDKGLPYFYLEVETRANRLANYLRRIGVGADVRVALYLERGFDLAVATLGVLKAGGAYVPINRAWPEERIAQVLDDAAIPVILIHEALREGLPTTWGRVISIDTDWPDVAAEDAERPHVELHPEMTAYVIYTSGSTGRPKGVCVSHRALSSRINTLAEMYGLKAGDRVLQFVSPAFDPFGLEFYPSLIRGAAVAFEPGITEMSGAEIARLERERGITVSLLLPAQLEEVAAAVRALPESERLPLRLLLSGGEAVSAAGVTAWQETFKVPTLHQYGPTEATILASAYARDANTPPAEDATALVLGRPIADTQLYVLGDEGQLCPLGVPGELYIGGAGVARGYLNRPDLTAERFIPDPFSTVEGARLYRTGDVARWRDDGQLEFLGRQDEQIKLRGYRIELGEIEAALASHGSVRGCAVMLREVAGTPALVGYVTGEADAAELREYLAKQLPAYMVPQRVVKLDALPLTANGKVDRKALPDPDEQEASAAGNYSAPRTATEEIVCGIWSDVLGLGRVGIGENFFELGGHSLLVTQVVARVRAVFGVEVPLRVLFETPLVEAVAAEVERLMKRRGGAPVAPKLTRADRDKPLPLSFAQQRLWFIDQLEPGNPAYNVPLAVRLGGELDVDALAASLTEIVRRHEVLRTSFPIVDGAPVQLIHEARPVPVRVVDVSDFDTGVREQAARQLADAEASRPFDLAAETLLVRALLVRLGEEDHALVVVLHHIVADGWSADVLIREFGQLYEAFRQGQPSPLAELPIQYADYAVWQREWLQGDVLEAQLQYWRKQLEGIERLELPFVRPGAGGARAGAAVQFTLPADVAAAIRKLSREESATLYMTLLASFQALLFRYSGQRDIALGTPVAGRDLVESEPLVGFFVNVLIIRTRLSAELSFRELVRQVRDASVAAYAHGQLPFELVAAAVAGGERQLGEDALFQATFDFAATAARGKVAGTDAEFFELADLPVKRDLNLVMMEAGASLVGSLQYDAAKMSEADAQMLVDNLARLLAAVAANPGQPVIDIPLGDARAVGASLTDESELEPDFAF
ncbi:MAG: hypothetical protein QOG00_2874, partial [Pyrinomonadaceae bacterium]|nr:hypothetical protein [Pyrinomonadaceae bacterium]